MSQAVITKSLAEKLALGRNGSYGQEQNALQHTLYDTARVPVALGANINYYTQPIGAPYGNGNKTINETNLTDPGKLPNGQTFVGLAMSLALKANAASAAAATNELHDNILSGFYSFIQNSVFEFTISGREYDLQVPGTEFLPAVALAVPGTANSRNTGEFWTSGWVKVATTPLILGSMVSFSVKQIQGNQITAAVTAINTAMAVLNAQDAEIQIRIRGILKRSV